MFVILFFVLSYFWKKKFTIAPGYISGLFLVFYSIFRFLIEFLRVPDEQLGYFFLNLTMGQIMSFIFFSIGIFLFITKYETRCLCYEIIPAF